MHEKDEKETTKPERRRPYDTIERQRLKTELNSTSWSTFCRCSKHKTRMAPKHLHHTIRPGTIMQAPKNGTRKIIELQGCERFRSLESIPRQRQKPSGRDVLRSSSNYCMLLVGRSKLLLALSRISYSTFEDSFFSRRLQKEYGTCRGYGRRGPVERCDRPLSLSIPPLSYCVSTSFGIVQVALCVPKVPSR